MKAPAPPPRFVVRATVATLIMVGFLLSAVFIVVMLDVRDRVRGAVSERLVASQRMLSALEHRRTQELLEQAATLAENPTLKYAMHAYATTRDGGDRRLLVNTIASELDTIASRLHLDAIAVADSDGSVLAVAGRLGTAWPHHLGEPSDPRRTSAEVVSRRDGVFRVASTALTAQGATLGRLQLGIAIDGNYARELSVLSGAGTVIASGDAILASTLPNDTVRTLTPERLRVLPMVETIKVGTAEYAVRLLFRAGPAAVYVVDSIDASAAPALGRAIRAIAIIAVGAFALALLATIWLARTIAKPIDTLSRSLSEMTQSRDFENPLAPTGYSLEVDTLTAAFNTMMQSVSTAEAQTRSAYVGAIRALAAALDARDPYTAGHSERVSTLSVIIGRQMGLPDDELEIVRLGALLHDIGKIGISDDVLRKAAPLTAAEFEVIKQHPGVGARILRSVPFLAPHIPIVELHHERPDGQGYPHGLRGDEIPVPARIVHVADAFDAMTSARAYRRRRDAADAMRELWHCAGSQFDADVVQAFAAAMPNMDRVPVGDARPVVTPSAARLAIVSSAARP